MTEGWNKAEQAFANQRLAERQRANSPWPVTPVPGLEGDSWAAKQVIHGVKDVVRCTLPHNGSQAHMINHAALQIAICRLAGGFTSWPVRGAWINDSGAVEAEEGRRYEVSFDPDSAMQLALVQAFELAGREQGEQVTYIETVPNAFIARHCVN